MRRFIFAVLILIIGVNCTSRGYSADAPTVAELQQQIQKLKAENEALKKENQALRKLAFERQTPAQTTVQPAPNQTEAPTLSKPATTGAATEGKYWMTTSSSKR